MFTAESVDVVWESNELEIQMRRSSVLGMEEASAERLARHVSYVDDDMNIRTLSSLKPH